MKIHMDIERVAELAVKIKDLSHFLYHSTDELKSQANHISWTGPSADDFFRLNLAAYGRIHILAEEVAVTCLDVNQEKEQWVDVDQQGVNRLKQVDVASKAPGSASEEYSDDHKADWWEDIGYSFKYFKFNQWWKTQTIDEKKQYLQDIQERLAERYGMPKVLVVVDNLPDPANGDSQGLNVSGVLMIDVENMNTDKPWRLIETLFHETRHDYQNEVVANYQNNGQIPEGITQFQV